MSNNVSAPANQADPMLAEHAAEIRRLGKRALADVIEIGRRLAVCKDLVGHGNFGAWLKREFAWCERTAQNFMNVHEFSKSATVADLDIPLRVLYLLAAPSTPQTARTEIMKRAQGGEVIPLPEVRRAIDAAKSRNQSVKRAEMTGDVETVTPSVDAKGRAVAEAYWDIGASLNNVTASPGEIARKLARLEELEIENAELREAIEQGSKEFTERSDEFYALCSEAKDLRSENAGLREAIDEANKLLTKLSDEFVALHSKNEELKAELAQRAPARRRWPKPTEKLTAPSPPQSPFALEQLGKIDVQISEIRNAAPYRHVEESEWRRVDQLRKKRNALQKPQPLTEAPWRGGD